jgi:hypothetical protein
VAALLSAPVDGFLDSVAVGLLTGIAASLITWWLLTFAIRPKLALSPNIAVAGPNDFRIKFQNVGSRDAHDVSVSIYLMFAGSAPDDLPTGLCLRSRWLPTLRSRKAPRGQEWWSRIRPEDVSAGQLQAYKELLPPKDFLAISTNQGFDVLGLLNSVPPGGLWIEARVSAADHISNSRSTVDRTYQATDFCSGEFRIGDLTVLSR